MTVSAGILLGQSAYLVAHSRVKLLDSEHTDGDAVTLELLVLSPKVACVSRGDAATIREVADRLRQDLQQATLEAALERESVIGKGERFHLLVATFDDAPRLYHLSHEGLDKLKPQRLHAYGALDRNHLELIAGSLPAAFDPYSPDITLGGIVAITQARSRGTVFGARVDETGIHLHQPIAFAMYRSCFADRDSFAVDAWTQKPLEFPSVFALVEQTTGSAFVTPAQAPFFDWTTRPPALRPSLGTRAIQRVETILEDADAWQAYFTRAGKPPELSKSEHPIQLRVEPPFGFELVGAKSVPGQITYSFQNAFGEKVRVHYRPDEKTPIEVLCSKDLEVDWEVDEDGGLTIKTVRENYAPVVSTLVVSQ